MTAIVKQPQQGFSMVPQTFEEACRFAKIIADSSLAPKNYAGKVGDILVAIQMGNELGLQPMQALANIAVVNGRASLWGDAVVAVCMQHALWGGMVETVDGDGMNAVATCTVVRKGMEPVTRTFSMADAKTAGLLGKQGPWSQYPRRMLQMRARGFALRDAFPDALRGIVSQDEARDMEPIKATVVQNTVKREELPADASDASKDPIVAGLREEMQKPREERAQAAIDPELDPEDYTIMANGKNKGKMLRELGIPQLEWYADNSRDPQLKLYAAAALAQRIANSPKVDEPEQGPDGWGLGGEQAEVAP